MNPFLEKAVEHLEFALLHKANFIPALVSLCEYNLGEKNFGKVNNLLQKACYIEKNEPVILFLKAKLHLSKSELAKAKNFILQAIAINRDEIQYHKILLEIETKNGNLHGTIDALEKIIDLEPSDGEAHLLLAQKLSNPDDFQRARLLYEISIELLPKDKRPLILLSKHLCEGCKGLPDGTIQKIPEIEKSIELLHAAIQIDKACAESHFMLGRIFFEEENFKSAEKYLNVSLQDTVFKFESFFLMGLIHQKENKLEEAINFFKKASESINCKSKSLLALIEIYLQRKEYSNAEQELMNIIPILISELDKLHKLTKTQTSSNQFYEARKTNEKISSKKRNLSQCYYYRYVSKNQETCNFRDLPLLFDAIDEDPFNSQAHFEIGVIKKETGKKESSRKHFEESLNADWFNWQSHLEISEFEKEDQNLESCVMHLQIALDLKPNSEKVQRALSAAENSKWNHPT